MRALGLLLLALAFQAPPSPLPHGPYADRDGWVCYYGPTREAQKRVHCECKSRCDNDGMEDKSCLTYCTSPKCQCHLDDSCDIPDAPSTLTVTID